MEDEANFTIDPTCLGEPPYAIDVINNLDVFGICLYSMLTFMSCVTLLLYLEQCAFVYKKLPYPKKTTIIWISGASPIISTMACLGMWIPRAVMFTDMTSNCYFAVVVYKVIVLIVEELGGTSAFLSRFSSKPFKISTGPCCCCCLCLPWVPMSRRMLFILKLGALQYALLKTALTILSIVLWTNGNFDLAELSITCATIWINPFLGVLLCFSLWPVGIIFMNTKGYLRGVKVVPKYAFYQIILVLSQLQTAIINILALNGSIACSPPFSSQARGSMLSQQIMIMEMFLISLFTRNLYRRTYEDIPDEAPEEQQNNLTALPEH
ncbi:Organic solute transporter subunit alpha [Oryzias melastigma]|uniref:Organic solute transporter subunit alpha n=1 Tax=Oryzias melastigma TaxID=30732 RepID=A0A834CGG8_ORYME|nr:Organic solute transporter subunit alpha [Oryzias melastigma]